MKLSNEAMTEINQLVDDIDDEKLDKEQIIQAILSIHGYLSIIDAEGDREDD